MSSLFVAKKISPDLAVQEGSTPIPVDVYQANGKLIILAPIAGITIEDISVTITDDILVISGMRRKSEDVGMGDYFSQECFWGEFNRSIVLPVNVDSDKVAAFYKRGLLRIEMPIVEIDKTRVIPVKMANE